MIMDVEEDIIDIEVFKDGVADGLLYGVRDDKQSSYYYKLGYDFGLTLFGRQQDESA